MAGPHSAFANLLEMYKQKNSHEGEGWWRVNLPTGFEHSSSMSNNIHTSHQIMAQGRFEIYAKGLFSNDGVLRRALLGTWSAWGTLEDWGELEGCTLWRLLETLCSPGWQISTRNYIFSLSLYLHLYALFWPRTYIHLLHRCFKSEQNNQRLGFFSFTLQAGYSTSI